MAASIDDTKVVLMELQDVKVAKLLTDPSTAEPTYGEWVDLAGILTLQISPEMETKNLQGDSIIMDTYSRITGINFTVTNSVLSFSGLEVIMGGKVTRSGTDLTEKVTYSMTADAATPPYFKIEGKWNYPSTDGTVADAHVTLYKCRMTEAPDFDINDASGDFGECSFTGSAVPTNYSGKWWDMILNATAEEIGAGE